MAASSQEHGFQAVKAKGRFAPGSAWLPTCVPLVMPCGWHLVGVGMGHRGQSAASFRLLPGAGQRNFTGARSGKHAGSSLLGLLGPREGASWAQ